MTPKKHIDPIWIALNSALAEDLNPALSAAMVQHLHDVMGWDLSSDENDVLWDGLQDADSYYKE